MADHLPSSLYTVAPARLAPAADLARWLFGVNGAVDGVIQSSDGVQQRQTVGYLDADSLEAAYLLVKGPASVGVASGDSDGK